MKRLPIFLAVMIVFFAAGCTPSSDTVADLKSMVVDVDVTATEAVKQTDLLGQQNPLLEKLVESSAAIAENTKARSRHGLTPGDVVGVYADHEGEISKVWEGLPDGATMTEAVETWLDSKQQPEALPTPADEPEEPAESAVPFVDPIQDLLERVEELESRIVQVKEKPRFDPDQPDVDVEIVGATWCGPCLQLERMLFGNDFAPMKDGEERLIRLDSPDGDPTWFRLVCRDDHPTLEYRPAIYTFTPDGRRTQDRYMIDQRGRRFEYSLQQKVNGIWGSLRRYGRNPNAKYPTIEVDE